MKILVLSDSHSTLSFMRLCIQSLCPDAVVHLGDHYQFTMMMPGAHATVLITTEEQK